MTHLPRTYCTILDLNLDHIAGEQRNRVYDDRGTQFFEPVSMTRLSTVLSIPPLSLVVVGAGNGRVVIITPLLLDVTSDGMRRLPTFRVEAVLPTVDMLVEQRLVRSPLLVSAYRVVPSLNI